MRSLKKIENYIGRSFVSCKNKVSGFWIHGVEQRKVITLEDLR